MALDPSIPLGVQRPKFNTPFENLDVVLQAQQRQQSLDINEAKLRESEQAQRDQQAVQSILQQTGGDWEKALPQIRQVAPQAALQIEEELGKQRKSRVDALKAEADLETTLTDKFLKRLQAVPEGDDELYQFVVGNLPKELSDLQPHLPRSLQEPDAKSRLDGVYRIGLTSTQVYERQKHALDLALGGKWRAALGTALSTATDQTDWDETLAGFKELGAPSRELAPFGMKFSPEAVQKAAMLSMTPEERAQMADRGADNARQEAQQAEAMRHNRATEGIAAGSLGVARGNLALRQQEAAGGAGGGSGPLSAGDAQVVEAVLKHPGLYADMTPTKKQQLIPALSARGFNFATALASGAKGGPNVANIMHEIDTLSQRINTSGGGPLSNITGALRRGKASVNLDNDMAEYESLVVGMIPMVARATGHTGVLTQQDVDSTRNLFPKAGDNATLAKNKIERVRRLIGGGAAAPPPPEAGTGVTVTAPNGKTYTFPNQAQADVFKKRAGIK